MPTSCFVQNCKNVSASKQSRVPGLSFHTFLPEGNPLRKAWVLFCQRDRLPSKWDIICGTHFCHDDYVHKNSDNIPNGKNILKSTAVPTRRGPDELRSAEYQSPKERWFNQLADEIKDIQDIVKYAPRLQPRYCVASFSKGSSVTAVIFPSVNGTNPSEWFGRCMYFIDDVTPLHHPPGAGETLPLPPSPITCLSGLIQELDAFFAFVTCAGFSPSDDANENAKHGQAHPTAGGVVWRSEQCTGALVPKPNQTRCEHCQHITRLIGKSQQRRRRRVSSVPHKKCRYDYLSKEELIEALKTTRAELKRVKCASQRTGVSICTTDTEVTGLPTTLEEESVLQETFE